MESNTLSKLNLVELIEFIDNIFFAGSLALNALLLYLIFCRSSARLQPYRPILLQTCIVDVFFAVVNGIFKVHIESKDGFFYAMLGSSWSEIPRPYNEIVVFAWVFGLFHSLTAIPICFVYRYVLIIKKREFTAGQYAMLLIPSFLTAFWYMTYGVWVFWHDPDEWNRAAELLCSDPYYVCSNLPNFIVAHISRWSLRIMFSYCYFLVIAAYAITIVANYKVWKHLKIMQQDTTSSNQNLQKQITHTLIIQASIPIVVCAFPIGFAVTTSMLYLNIRGLVMMLSFIWCWLPILHPIVTIAVIHCYRNHIFNVLRSIIHKKVNRHSLISHTNALPSSNPSQPTS